jgi:uncharacterized UPF0160 family protein
MKTIEPLPVVSTLPATLDKKNAIIIGTHSGNFHCDEALACGMLSLLSDQFPRDRTIVLRSRDPSALDQCNILVDVGGEYNPERLRFDHHQKSFDDLPLKEKTFSEKFETKLSSAGLVYKHYGQQILFKLINHSDQVAKPLLDRLSKEEYNQMFLDLYERIYKNFMEHIDAIDNGIEISEGKLRYKITTTLSNRVGRLNPKWNAPKEELTTQFENSQFQKAMVMTIEEFLEVVNGYLEQWLPAKSIVLETVKNRFNVDPSGKIVRFDQFCPWKEHLFTIERELGIPDQIQLALFADASGAWRVQSVPIEGMDFANRCPLPIEWRGLRDQELSDKSGIPGCIFVHMSGFIGGNKTYEGALQMARETLRLIEATKK